MANLVTSHDPFHIHKILGFLSLVHFLVRFVLLVYRGYGFCTVDNDSCTIRDVQRDVAGVLLHGLLSWSSLFLPIPQKRNFNSPMIWPEMRWHSIVFATRHVLGCAASVLGWWPRNHLVANTTMKLALVLGTCFAADIVTRTYGCTVKRTTNATKHPDHINPYVQKSIKLNYAIAQFIATISSVSEDADFAFLPLCAIQGAAFLMTLCRKNIIRTETWHRVYILQLTIPLYLPFFAIVHRGKEYAIMVHVIGALFLIQKILRIDCRISKYITWPIVVFFLQLITNWSVLWNLLLWEHTNPWGVAFVTFAHLNENNKILVRYVPMFITWSYTEEPDVLSDYIWMGLEACFIWLVETTRTVLRTVLLSSPRRAVAQRAGAISVPKKTS